MSRISFKRAFAICAFSKRAITSSAVMLENASTIMAYSSLRAADRAAVDKNKGSVANSGINNTCSQKITHSLSFCKPNITVLPSPAGNGPYG